MARSDADKPSASLILHPLSLANPRLYLVNWNNRLLPMVPTDAPLSLSGDVSQRFSVRALATSWTRDGIQRQLGGGISSRAPLSTESRADEGYLRIRSAGLGGDFPKAPRLTTLIAGTGSIAETLPDTRDDSAKFDPPLTTGVPTALAVLLAIGGIAGLYLLKRSLED